MTGPVRVKRLDPASPKDALIAWEAWAGAVPVTIGDAAKRASFTAWLATEGVVETAVLFDTLDRIEKRFDGSCGQGCQTPEVKRHEFLTDVIINYVEGGPYSWFDVRKYEWYHPDHGGSGKPGPDGCGSASAEIRVNRSEEGVKSGPWKRLNAALIAEGFDRLVKGPVEGLGEEYRARLIGAFMVNDSGMLDLNDDDVVMQIAMLGEVVYA